MIDYCTNSELRIIIPKLRAINGGLDGGGPEFGIQ